MLAEVVRDVDALEAVAPHWDALAVAADRPFCAPGWMLPWWRHVRGRDARLAVVIVRDGTGAFVALAPFFAQPFGPLTQLRFLGVQASVRHDIVSVGERDLVSRAIVDAAWDALDADIVSLEGAYEQTDWSDLLATSGDGTTVREWTMASPCLELGADTSRTFDEWFETRSRNFRQQMRRDRRNLEAEGARFRMTLDPDDLERDVGRFAQLHHSRWQSRGGSASLTGRLQAALVDVGYRLLPSGRFRLWNLEAGERPIASHLFLAAGGEVSYWLGGFDERWARFRPSMQTILVAIEDAWRRGERRMDLGAGAQDYKHRFADRDDVVLWTHVVRPGRLAVVARSLLAVRRRRRTISARVPDRARGVVRAARRRGRAFGADANA